MRGEGDYVFLIHYQRASTEYTINFCQNMTCKAVITYLFCAIATVVFSRELDIRDKTYGAFKYDLYF